MCPDRSLTPVRSTNQSQRSKLMSNVASNYSNKLQFETEEKKEQIMNDAIDCIFNRLPQTIQNLDQVLVDLYQLGNSYRLESLKPNSKLIDKYRFVTENPMPLTNPLTNNDNKVEYSKLDNSLSPRQLLQSVCVRHLTQGSRHMCTKNYSFTNSMNLFSWGSVTTNDEMKQFGDRLRPIFTELSQFFLIINLGLSLMFPRTEDNEDCNLSLEVLNKLIQLATLEYPDFFETNVKERADLIETIASYPHFGESTRMLFEFDRNSVFELQVVVQNLITQCGRLYDSLVKNFDMVLKAKGQCDQTRDKPNTPTSDNASTIGNSIYS